MVSDIEKLEIEIALLQRVTTEPIFVILGADFVRLPELQALKYKLEQQANQHRRDEVSDIKYSMSQIVDRINVTVDDKIIDEVMDALNVLNTRRLKLLSEIQE